VRTLVGRCVTVGEVMQVVMRDKKFYENSDGGVILPGGELMSQRKFALSILQSCKKARLHSVLDTCGYTPWASMKEILEYTDLVLYRYQMHGKKEAS
jgi:pyruvate formate lyase activating enzyme